MQCVGTDSARQLSQLRVLCGAAVLLPASVANAEAISARDDYFDYIRLALGIVVLIGAGLVWALIRASNKSA